DVIDQIMQKLHVDSVCCFGLRHVGVRKTRHPSEVPAGVRPCYHWAARSPSEPVGNSNATGMPAFQKSFFINWLRIFSNLLFDYAVLNSIQMLSVVSVCCR